VLTSTQGKSRRNGSLGAVPNSAPCPLSFVPVGRAGRLALRLGSRVAGARRWARTLGCGGTGDPAGWRGAGAWGRRAGGRHCGDSGRGSGGGRVTARDVTAAVCGGEWQVQLGREWARGGLVGMGSDSRGGLRRRRHEGRAADTEHAKENAEAEGRSMAAQREPPTSGTRASSCAPAAMGSQAPESSKPSAASCGQSIRA
jgi:hypothetical protein